MRNREFKENLKWIETLDSSGREFWVKRFVKDCEEYLRESNDECLWAGDVKQQLSLLRKLYECYPKDSKPDYLTIEQIENYEKQMIR